MRERLAKTRPRKKGWLVFTVLAIVAGSLIAWRAARDQKADSDDIAINTKHSRQDMRLIAFLLFGILIALGIIADRIP
jgi:hypothetical protein